MELSSIYLISVGVVCIFWIYAALDNGHFDKKETVQLFLIVTGAYIITKIPALGLGELAIVLGSLLLSVGMQVFKLLANGKTDKK